MQRKNWERDHFYHDTEKKYITNLAGLHANWTSSLSKIAFLVFFGLFGFFFFFCFLVFKLKVIYRHYEKNLLRPGG